MYEILCIHICSAFVGLDNKLYKMHGTYNKIVGSICRVLKKRKKVPAYGRLMLF